MKSSVFDQSLAVSVQLPDTRKVNKLAKCTSAEGVSFRVLQLGKQQTGQWQRQPRSSHYAN